MSRTQLIHYRRADGKTVCGRKIYGSLTIRVTSDPTKITCLTCKSSPYMDDPLGGWHA